MYYFYKITNPRGKFYIGQTNEIERRKREYRNIQAVRQQKLIYASLLKYGWDNHKFDIIYKSDCDDNKANKLEIEFIKAYRSWWYENKKYGLNLTIGGGQRTGTKHSEETKKKMRDSFDEQRRKNLSDRMKNRVVTDEAREKMRIRMSSPEYIERLIKNRKVSVGSQHGMTTLTEEQVYKIKLAISSGTKRSIILEEFGITKSVYQHIKSEVTWSHVVLREEDLKNNKPKSVYQYDLNGNFIKEWTSVKAANKAFSINSSAIRYCCEKKVGHTQAAGFKWSYLQNDNIPVKKMNRLMRPEHFVKVDQYNKEGVFIKQWNSIKEVVEKLGLQRFQVQDCCKGKRKAVGEYVFKYHNKRKQYNKSNVVISPR